MNRISRELLKIASQLNKIGKIAYYSDLDDYNFDNVIHITKCGFQSGIVVQQYKSQSELDDIEISQQIQKINNEIKSNIYKNTFADGIKLYEFKTIYFVGFVIVWKWIYSDDDQDEFENSEKQMIRMLKKYENKFDVKIWKK